MDIVILAAGLGTRMKSSKPKILHKIFDISIIDYIIETAKKLNPENIFVVLNPKIQELKDHLSRYELSIVYQEEPRGTAHAFLSALPELKSNRVLILNGDTPLLKAETLFKLIEIFEKNNLDIAILTFYAERDNSYGRIIRDRDGNVQKIVEMPNLSEEERSILESNSGVYLFTKDSATLTQEIGINELKGEYYLTDIVEIALKKGKKVAAFPLAKEEELIGINTRYELSLAIKYLRDRIVNEWMDRGVTFYDPKSVWISPKVFIDEDTVIYPNVYLEGETKIGKNCIIYQGVRLKDCIIEDYVNIKDHTVAENARIGANSVVGPFTHLRSETAIGKDCRIGNFVEVKKSSIGNGTKASHLSYLGDAQIGENVNIGAGTITCNYDGKRKHKTVIENNVFIGSDTQLVAPVKINKDAYIGAGSTITKEVPEGSLAISRTPQKNILGWAKRKRDRE